jgi:hypothetical protein
VLGVNINLKPITKAELQALSQVREVQMSDIAYAALEAYLATPAQRVDAPKRDRAATAPWFLRLTPSMEMRLNDRAAQEMGPPTGAFGAGRKMYRAGVIRRALELYLSQLPREERDGVETVVNVMATVRA